MTLPKDSNGSDTLSSDPISSDSATPVPASPGSLTTNSLLSLLQTDEAALGALRAGALFSAPSFAKALRGYMENQGLSVSGLLAAADISKTFAYQLLRGARRPGRDVVLRMALALRLPLSEAQKLLTLSDNNILYPRLRRDGAVVYALSKGLSLAETEELLASLPERSLYL